MKSKPVHTPSLHSVHRYQLQSEILSALAHPIRLAIVDLLKEDEVCVCEIAEKVGAEQSNTSRHLSLMQRAGVLKTRKQGQQVFYSLRTPCVLTFLACAQEALEAVYQEKSRSLSA